MSSTPPASAGYTPSYVSFDDVPIAGPDTYDQPEKERAVWSAEGNLEADVNDGQPLEDPEKIHAFAVSCFATHVLTGGAEAPEDVTLGDINDGQVADYARTYMDLYRHAINSINRSDDEGGRTHHIVTKP